MTYALKINFRDGRTYSRTGLSWDAAMGLKEWFITHVPPAVSGSMWPEGRKAK